MKQSRIMSLIEAITNVIVGYGVAVMTQMLIFPIFGLQTTLRQNLAMGGIHDRQPVPIVCSAAAF